MVERQGTDTTATLRTFPTAMGGVPPALGNRQRAGTGDCPGRDVGGTAGPNPDPSRCTAQFAGFTAVCWDTSCTYKILPAASCTGGARPERKYTCNVAVGGAALSGTWIAVVPSKGFRKSGYRIVQDGSRLTFSSPDGAKSTGFFQNGSTVVAEQWKVTGTVKNNGKRIEWNNGSYWEGQ
jgi:hypothetical protein